MASLATLSLASSHSNSLVIGPGSWTPLDNRNKANDTNITKYKENQEVGCIVLDIDSMCLRMLFEDLHVSGERWCVLFTPVFNLVCAQHSCHKKISHSTTRPAMPAKLPRSVLVIRIHCV